MHLDFVVPELEAAVSRAIEAGATIEGEIQAHNWGRIAHMTDPFGHGICLSNSWAAAITKSPTRFSCHARFSYGGSAAISPPAGSAGGRSRPCCPVLPGAPRLRRIGTVAAVAGLDLARLRALISPPSWIALIRTRALRGRYTDSRTTSIRRRRPRRSRGRASARHCFAEHFARSRPCSMLATSRLVSRRISRRCPRPAHGRP